MSEWTSYLIFLFVPLFFFKYRWCVSCTYLSNKSCRNWLPCGRVTSSNPDPTPIILFCSSVTPTMRATCSTKTMTHQYPFGFYIQFSEWEFGLLSLLKTPIYKSGPIFIKLLQNMRISRFHAQKKQKRVKGIYRISYYLKITPFETRSRLNIGPDE